MSATCANCRHAQKTSVAVADTDGIGAMPNNGPLYCRRYPPTVFLVMIQPRIAGQQPGVNFVTSFPIVQPEANCGEFLDDPVYN